MMFQFKHKHIVPPITNQQPIPEEENSTDWWGSHCYGETCGWCTLAKS